MLPFLKRKNEAGAQAPAWHPNFRNFERLPDLKVVRTTFFINMAAVVAAVALLLLFVLQELKLRALDRQVIQWDLEIEADRVGSGQAVAKFRTFQAEEKKLLEVNAFLKTRQRLSDFLLRVGETLPEDIAITQVEYRTLGVTLRGVVRGGPEVASGAASAYLAQLKADEQLAPAFETIELTNLSRDPATNRLNVEYLLKFPVK